MSPEPVSQFSSERLDLARRLRGMTKSSLARSLGVTDRTVRRYFQGEREPGSDVVQTLAETLGFPDRFFFGDPLNEASQEHPSFRALSKLTARQRNQAVAVGTIGMYLSDWIERRFRLPSPSIPTYENGVATPEAAAMEVRDRWTLGQQPVSNIIHLLEYYGVRVFALPQELHSVNAHSFWYDGKPFMFLNTGMCAERSRMDAAHELGHLVLHSSEVAQKNRQLEREAQEFASVFLMPSRSVLANAQLGMTLPDIIRAKQYWNVSVANLTYRLHKLRLLTKHQYTSIFIQISRNGYRIKEPETSERETSQVLNKVFGRLREKGATVNSVADDLALHRDDISMLLVGLVSFPVSIGPENQQPLVQSDVKPTDSTKLHLV